MTATLAIPTDCIRLVERDLSGGRISRETIDTIEGVQSTSIEISGLRQDTFEYFVSQYGNRFRSIRFWKCPRIDDLTPLEGLWALNTLHFFWNQKTTRFWNLAKTPGLKELSFNDFGHVTDLTDLAASPSLEKLEFGNSFTGTSFINSLEPIGAISTLKHLCFNPKKVLDNKASPLTRLTQLRSLDFNNRLFSTEKVAWLTAHLPRSIESERLRPYVALGDSLLAGKDVLVNGRGKPFLSSTRDKARLDKYVARFESLVQQYQSNPTLQEPD
jgi:hypothetical protein